MSTPPKRNPNAPSADPEDISLALQDGRLTLESSPQPPLWDIVQEIDETVNRLVADPKSAPIDLADAIVQRAQKRDAWMTDPDHDLIFGLETVMLRRQLRAWLDHPNLWETIETKFRAAHAKGSRPTIDDVTGWFPFVPQGLKDDQTLRDAAKDINAHMETSWVMDEDEVQWVVSDQDEKDSNGDPSDETNNAQSPHGTRMVLPVYMCVQTQDKDWVQASSYWMRRVLARAVHEHKPHPNSFDDLALVFSSGFRINLEHSIIHKAILNRYQDPIWRKAWCEPASNHGQKMVYVKATAAVSSSTWFVNFNSHTTSSAKKRSLVKDLPGKSKRVFREVVRMVERKMKF